VLEELGERPTPEQILDLKVCDPAMGSGAFLVEACRQLAERLVAAWEAHDRLPELPPDVDPLLHAMRLVAQRCLYGVDKNPFAVDLAKLSLRLVTLARDHAFSFVDHALRCGDSLVGLTREQIGRFSWAAPRGEAPLLAYLDEQAEAALEDVRLVGDLVVAAFFEGAFGESSVQLEEALFRVESAVFSVERTWPWLRSDVIADRTADGERLAGAVAAAWRSTCQDGDAHGSQVFCELWEASQRGRGHCQVALQQGLGLAEWCTARAECFGEDGARDPGGGLGIWSRQVHDLGLYLNETTSLTVMQEVVDYLRTLDEAQRGHVWTRWWQWQLVQGLDFLVGLVRSMACRMHFNRDPEAPHWLCPDGAVPDCLGEDGLVPCEGDPCECPEDAPAAGRFVVADRCAQASGPPVCPPRAELRAGAVTPRGLDHRLVSRSRSRPPAGRREGVVERHERDPGKLRIAGAGEHEAPRAARVRLQQHVQAP